MKPIMAVLMGFTLARVTWSEWLVAAGIAAVVIGLVWAFKRLPAPESKVVRMQDWRRG